MMRFFSDENLGELNPLRAHDEEIRKREKRALLCGIDEVGRGPLAGPICAAAVILKPSAGVLDVRDSKKYGDRDKREKAWLQIKDHVIASGICLIDAEEIDEYGIGWANAQVMRRALLQAVGEDRDVVALFDGDPLWHGDVEGITCVWEEEADGRSLSVAAASILAKTHRDRLMIKLAEEHPNYGFDRHVGYGTTLHYDAIEKHGIIPGVHRKCFLTRLFDND